MTIGKGFGSYSHEKEEDNEEKESDKIKDKKSREVGREAEGTRLESERAKVP